MERLQHVLSTWKMKDLNIVMQLSDGDCELAIGRILRHESTGLPAEFLIRSLGSGNLLGGDDDCESSPGGGGGRKRQAAVAPGVVGGGGARGRDGFLQRSYDDAAVKAAAIRPPDYITTTSPRSAASSPPKSRITCDDNSSAYESRAALPPARAYEMGRHVKVSPQRSYSREPRVPACAAGISLPDIHPEVLLHSMSPVEKDQLLRQLLSSTSPRQSGRKVAIPDYTTKEVDVFNVQSGILMSLKELGGEKRMHQCQEDIDAEALEFGVRASKQEFRDLCRKRDQEEEFESTLLERARTESRKYVNPSAEQEQAQIERVKSESLRCANPSDQVYAQLIEDVVRVSLESTPSRSMTEEEYLIEEVKRDSLLSLAQEEQLDIEEVRDAHLSGYMATAVGGPAPEVSSLPFHRESRGGQDPPAASVRGNDDWSLPHRFSEYDMAAESVASFLATLSGESADGVSSSMSDRKPPARD